MHDQAGVARHVGGWLVAGALGCLAGYLVGLGAMGDHAHVMWPALAGFVIGVASSLAAQARQVLVALCGAGIAVAVAVATIVSVQAERGRWPITDELTLAHYGTDAQATMRAAVMLSVLVGVPCLIGAFLVAVAKRRHAWAAEPGQARGRRPGADQPRG